MELNVFLCKGRYTDATYHPPIIVSFDRWCIIMFMNNNVYTGAIIGALFCGWVAVAGCLPLSPPVVIEARPTRTLAAPTMVAPETSTATAVAMPPSPTLPNTPTPTPLQPTSIGAATSVAEVTDNASVAESAPAPAPVGTVVFYEEKVTLPTYPLERYQTDVVDPQYNWPYKRFDMERFRQEAPKPAPRTYRLLVLENAYLKVTILPELGGRIWQVIHKPTGQPMFYQNSVVKPTHWGIENQKGWLALGGLEWSLPVIEHGYDWGTPWGYLPLPYSEDLAAVTVFTPRDGRFLNASITISLRAGAASFEIEPTLSNLTDQKLAFSFWHDAMLAPGSGKRPSADLRFVLPTDRVTLHSTNDPVLPQPGDPFAWPLYAKRDLSRLGNFQQYLGFFEAPAAHGLFVGVYDPTYDAGAVRIFPAETMRGSKVFALGWQDRLTSDNFTDDDSMYVELHGGLAPTFNDQYQLPPNGQISWREVWYPVAGIGNLSAANELVALSVQPQRKQWAIALYATRPLDGQFVYRMDGVTQESLPFQAQPDSPYRGLLSVTTSTTDRAILEVQDSAGRPLLTYPLSQEQ